MSFPENTNHLNTNHSNFYHYTHPNCPCLSNKKKSLFVALNVISLGIPVSMNYLKEKYKITKDNPNIIEKSDFNLLQTENFPVHNKCIYYISCSDPDQAIDCLVKNLRINNQEVTWQSTGSMNYTIHLNKPPLIKGDYQAGSDYELLIEDEHQQYFLKPLTQELYESHVMDRVAFGNKLKGKTTEELQNYFYNIDF